MSGRALAHGPSSTRGQPRKEDIVFTTRSNLPGPKGAPLLGNWKQFREGGAFFIHDVIRTYGNTAFLRIAHLSCYVFNEPEDIREVLGSQSKSFYKDRTMKKALGRFIGAGLTANDGESWKRQRKLIQPAFSSQRLDGYAVTMLDCMARQVNAWTPGLVYEMAEEATNYTMDVTNRTMFGTGLHDVTDPVALMDAIANIQQIVRDQLGAIFIGLPDWIPTPSNRRIREALTVLDSMVHNLIHERRNRGGNDGDFLSLLLAARDDDGSGMSDTQLRDELVTMVIAGQESASNALCWTWYLLAQHPAIEERVFEELDRVVGQRPLEVADLPRLQYLEMVLKESMRLYPPGPLLAREAMEPARVGSAELRPGDIALVSPYAAQRHPRYFPDPERFDPERFRSARDRDAALALRTHTW
jgi:cytochrome P450